MSLRVRWVRYGGDAAEALLSEVAAVKGDEPLAPVTVVVASNHVGVATRRLLASGRVGSPCRKGVGLAAVSFVTPYRVAELLGASRLAGAGRRPVSTPIIATAIRAALASDPGVFSPVASHAATEAALVAAYRELRELSPAALDALATASQRSSDVIRLHRLARARLEDGWYDEQDLTECATSAVTGGDRLVAGFGTVIVYLPQRLGRHAAGLMAALAERSLVSVLAGVTGDARADAEVRASLARLAGGGEVAERPQVEPAGVVDPGRTCFVTASDAEDEVRAAVRAVVDAVRTGTRLDRVAIVYASPDPYARLVHDQLSAAGVPANGASVVTLAGRVAGRTLLDLLRLPSTGFRRPDVLAWMAGAPIVDHGRPVPVAAWEQLSRQAAVATGRDDWDRLLTDLADSKEVEAEAADPDVSAWRAGWARAQADQARAMRRFVLRLIDDLVTAASGRRGWVEHARWARRLLDQLLGGAEHRMWWPEVERRGAERTEVALGRLSALGSLEGPVGLDVFARTLAVELEADLGRVGRFGEGVLVGSVAMAVGLDLDLLVVLGLVEGSLPGAVHDDALLPDDEREAALGELPLRRGTVDGQHRALLAGLAAARRHLLGIPRGDLRRSTERVPSRWALDLASAMAGERWWPEDLRGSEAPWVTHVASFDAGLRRPGLPATGQEHRLRSLLSVAPAPGDPGGLAGAGDPVMARGATVLAARRSEQFSRFDGNLGGLDIPSPVSTVTSPTRLERWAVCPLAYLLGDLLGVEPVEQPGEQLQITPLDRGSLIHSALERFMLEVLGRPAVEQPGPDQAWSGADRARMATIGEELCDDYQRRGLTGRAIFWRRDRAAILADLDRFLSVDNIRRRAERTRPLAAELAFGLTGSDLDAIPLGLPDGRRVRFRGRADRVDIAADGTLHVVDYKTGSRRSYQDISQEDPDQRGQRLQLAVYGAAALAHHAAPSSRVWAEYWFVSNKGAFERVGYHLTDEVLERVGRTLATIVEGIERGVFPAHPTASATTPWVDCYYCDPDGLGVTELRRSWERKRLDPTLARYANLAEPLEGVEAVVEGGLVGD